MSGNGSNSMFEREEARMDANSAYLWCRMDATAITAGMSFSLRGVSNKAAAASATYLL